MEKKKGTIIAIAMVGLFLISTIIYAFVDVRNKSAYNESTIDPNKIEYVEQQSDVTIIETTSEVIKLSESCDKILATGSNKNGDFYELVANQEETYDDVKIKIGVIKNNEWLLEPTSDIPFIDKETGLIKISLPGISAIGIDDVEIRDYDIDNIYGTFEYVADGCFCVYTDITKDVSWTGNHNCSIIYNAENKKAYYNDESYFIFTSLRKEAKHGNQLLIQDRYSVGITGNCRSDFYILDTNTMKTKMIVEGTEYNIVGPMGDGLFAVGDSFYSNSIRNAISYFYDSEGNKIIDLTSYNDGEVYAVDKAYFADGKFTFLVKNDAGTEFQVTIDTTGNVISSVENPKEE